MNHLFRGAAVGLVVAVALLFGVREARRYFRHRGEVVVKAVPYKLPPGVEPFHPKVDVNLSLDINVTDIVAAAAGGAFAWRKMHQRKKA